MRQFFTLTKWLALLGLCMTLSATANAQISQTPIVLTYVATTTGTSATINLTNSSVDTQILQWRISSSGAASCTVALDSSTDGSTWVAGGAIAGQTCTSAGEFTASNTVSNYVRIDVTALSANFTLTVIYVGRQATAAARSSGGSGAITNQVLNQLPLGGASAGAISGTVANGLTGQVLQSTNAAAPSFVSPALPWGNGSAAVTATPYSVACDSGTAVVDRGSTILFQSGASVINLPDPTAAGCAGNFAVSLYDDGAGTLTVNRGGTSTINVMDGTTNTDGATSFTLATGQTSLCNANAAGTIWACRKLTGGSSVAQFGESNIPTNVTPSGTQFMTFLGTLALASTSGPAQTTAARAGTVGNLRVRITGTEGAAATLAITLLDGATAEAVTCTVGNSTSTCTDLTHTFAFAAGDLLSWQTVQTGTGTSSVIFISYTIQ